MTFIQALVFSLTQGITEFLPISSKGHLNLVQSLLGFIPSLSFDIFLNTATLLSVFLYFRHQKSYFFKNLPYIFLGSLPAIFFGFLFQPQVESLVTHTSLLPFFFLITTGFLLLTKIISPAKKSLTPGLALIIGFSQALALLPGVSRSGLTISTALLLGLSTTEAFNFSFSLFIPASLGALALNFYRSPQSLPLSPNYLIAFIVTFFVGFLALSFLKKLLTSNHLWIFGIYTLLLSLVLFLFPF